MKTDIDRLQGNYNIYFNGRYIVLPGTKLYIFKPDGSCVACRKDLRYAGRITFLSEDRMLLSSKSVVHMMDLQDGSDLWTLPFPKTEFNLEHFAVTPDEACAYTFDHWKGQLFLTRLDLNQQEIDTYDISYDVGVTRDIICDGEGVPCVLKTYRESIGGKVVTQNGVRIQDYDILYRGSSYYWKSKWQFDGTRCAECFLGSTDRIVTSDLHIYEPSSGSEINLLEKDSEWQRPVISASTYWTDIMDRYLCLSYPTGNVVIDMQGRRAAAQYTGAYTRGCIVGEEYWICDNERICRKPFPATEALPPLHAAGFADEIFSQHLELW